MGVDNNRDHEKRLQDRIDHLEAGIATAIMNDEFRENLMQIVHVSQVLRDQVVEEEKARESGRKEAAREFLKIVDQSWCCTRDLKEIITKRFGI